MASTAEELILRISGDSAGGQKALGDLEGHITSLLGSLKGAVTEGLGPMGPAFLVVTAAGAALGTALFELGQEATQTGAELQRVALTTNMAVGPLSDLKFAMDATGGSIDQLNTVMFMFEQRMENSTATVSKGLALIGLSLDQIGGMSRDQQILAISDAFRTSGEDVNRAAAAMDIFGRQGRAMLPELMQDLSGLVDKSKELGNTWAEEDAEAAHKFEIASKTMAAEAASAWTQFGREVMPVTNDIVLAYERMKLAIANVGLATAETFVKVADTLRHLAGSTGDLALASETAAAKQDTITKALSLGAPAGIAFGDAVKYVNEALRSDGVTQGMTADEMKVVNAEYEKGQRAAEAYEKQIQTLVDTLEGHNKTEGEMVEALRRVAPGLVTGTQEAERFRVAVQKLHDEGVTVPPMLDAVAAGLRPIIVGLDLGSSAIEHFSLGLEQIGPRFSEFHGGLTGLADDGETLASRTLPDLSGGFADLGKDTDYASQQTMGLEAQLRELRTTSASFGDVLSTNLDASIKKLPKLLEQAFTGGGGMAGAALAFGTDLGSSLGKTVVTKFGSAITDTLGSTLGGAVNAILPGVGALIGPALSALFSIGGPSKQEIAGRGAEAQFEKSFGGFQGMMDAVGKAYDATGRSAEQAQADVKRLMDAEKQGGDAVKAVMASINKAFDDQKVKEQAVASGVTALQAAFTAAGGHIPASMQATIQTLLQMKGLTADESKAIKAMADGAAPDFEKLTSMAASYGISLQTLGPKFEQANLDKSAKKIFDDFTDLEKAGANVGGVLAGMADEISGLVSDSRKFGTAIPDNMRPLITELIRSGKLLDDNGNQIVDVSSISFEATPLDTSLQSLNATLQRLVDTLNNVPAAAQAAANSITSIPGPPNFDPSVYGGPQAEGGLYRVTKPTYFLAGEKPGGEDVAFSGVGRRFPGMTTAAAGPAKAGAPAGGGGDSYHFAFTIKALDAANVEQAVNKRILPAMIKVLGDGHHIKDLQRVLG